MKNKPLTIVFVTNNYKPYLGGVAKSVEVCRDALQKEGHTVNIITLDFLGKKTEHEEGVFRVPSPIRFLYKKNRMAVPWLPHTTVKKLIKQLQPDIIHAHHPFLLGQSALKAARSLDIPIVYTLHTMYERYTHYIPLPQLLVKRCVQKIVKSFCASVDGIILPSRAIKELVQRSTLSTRTMVIPSPIKEYFFNNRQKPVNKSNTKFNLITVSRFVKEKNIPFLLDLFYKLDQSRYHFTLVGYGSEQENLERHAYTTLGLSKENVTFVCKPEPEALVAQYDQADLFLFASTSDTQGLVLAESMARGTPVIALHGPGQKDSIVSGVNGFLINTQQEMINVIERVAHSSELLAMMRKQAIETAKNYAPETLAHKLLDFYKEIINKVK